MFRVTFGSEKRVVHKAKTQVGRYYKSQCEAFGVQGLVGGWGSREGYDILCKHYTYL